MRYFSPERLYVNWVYGGFLAAFLLLGLLPIISRDWPLAMTLVFLQLPIYMIHQYEEHDADRFRNFTTQLLGKGKEIFTSRAIFIINIPGVWGTNLLSILLAYYVDIGFGLIGVYLTLLNALAHIGQSIGTRGYNPGLVTAIVLFLPLSGAALWTISPQTTALYQLVGVFSSIAIHAAIMRYAFSKKKKAEQAAGV